VEGLVVVVLAYLKQEVELQLSELLVLLIKETTEEMAQVN
jgi:hypothetical protein